MKPYQYRTGMQRTGSFSLFLLLAVFSLNVLAAAEPVLPRYLSEFVAAEVFPGADSFGDIQGDPDVVPAFAGEEQVGYVYINSDFVNSTGYSGKPIHLLVAIDMHAIIRNVILVEHHEPIVLIGIPEESIVGVLDEYIGRDVTQLAD